MPVATHVIKPHAGREQAARNLATAHSWLTVVQDIVPQLMRLSLGIWHAGHRHQAGREQAAGLPGHRALLTHSGPGDRAPPAAPVPPPAAASAPPGHAGQCRLWQSDHHRAGQQPGGACLPAPASAGLAIRHLQAASEGEPHHSVPDKSGVAATLAVDACTIQAG